MNTILISLIVVSGLTNMIADLFLVSGKDRKIKNQSNLDSAEKTPVNHLFISGILGLISISFWVVPVYYLSKLPTVVGLIALFSFSMYIVAVAAFHVVASFCILILKFNHDKEAFLSKIIKTYGSVCILFSLIYTAAMMILSFSGSLNMQVWHYPTLPLFSMILIQFILGNVLKRIPYFSSVAGTLSMMISFLSTIHIMLINNIF
jgi:hypothetical protein